MRLDSERTRIEIVFDINCIPTICYYLQQSLYNTALMMQESRQPEYYQEAERRLDILMKLDPNNSKVYFTSALLATDRKNYMVAEEYFKKALQVIWETLVLRYSG